MSEAELRERIADLTKQIADARAYAFSGPDSEVMSRLEADVLPMQRVRRRLRHSLHSLIGYQTEVASS